MRKVLLTIFLAGVALNYSVAEVADSASGGFTVKFSENIHATPDEVYRRLVTVGDWWNSEHTFSGDAHNLSIEEKPDGCFCEKLPKGGAVRHMSVLYFQPGKMLRLGGGLGPLQGFAISGSMTIQLAAADDGTKLNMVYSVAGYMPAGMNTWAAPVDEVLGEQFTRLKNLVERGDPGKNETAMQK